MTTIFIKYAHSGQVRACN